MFDKESKKMNTSREIAELLYKENFRYIYKAVSVLVEDKAIVDDIVQEAFLKAFQNMNQLRDSTKFRSWLTSIAINLCKNYFTKTSKEFSVEKFYYNSSSQSSEDQFLETVTKDEIEQSLKLLDYNDREILMLKYHYGLSSKEIADYYKITVENVNVKVFRARQKFRKKLKERGI